MEQDFHVHSTYSDGRFMFAMVEAAVEAGLDGVGFADHCIVSERPFPRKFREVLGFTLDRTYERRRAGIEVLREQHDVEIYDAAELDYDPRDEDAIRAFLEDAGFDYAIGSVHELDGVNVHSEAHFEGMDRGERAAHVERYFEKLVALVDSELFAVAAHPDLIERNRALRGLATEEQYHRVAEAFADSRTVPEINAGRVLENYGEFHPRPAFLDVLVEYDLRVSANTDSHEPDQLPARVGELEGLLEDRGLDPVDVTDR